MKCMKIEISTKNLNTFWQIFSFPNFQFTDEEKCIVQTLFYHHLLVELIYLLVVVVSQFRQHRLHNKIVWTYIPTYLLSISTPDCAQWTVRSQNPFWKSFANFYLKFEILAIKSVNLKCFKPNKHEVTYIQDIFWPMRLLTNQLFSMTIVNCGRKKLSLDFEFQLN